MKRLLDFSDKSLPDYIAEYFPEKAAEIQRINEKEEDLDRLLKKRLRENLARSSEPEIKQAPLSIFLRHEYIPASNMEESHYLLIIEGRIEDKSLNSTSAFASFFNSIRIQKMQKKHQDKVWEWSVADFPDGAGASCFRVKLPYEKSTLVRVFLDRKASGAKVRYSLSPQLRALFPGMHTDPTEDDVMHALWQYLVAENLIFLEGKDKKTIQCNEILQDITGAESIPLNLLRSKILELMEPSRPIEIDYSLTVTNSSSSWSEALEHRKVVEMEVIVDIPDEEAFSSLAALNAKARRIQDTIIEIQKYGNFMLRIMQLQPLAGYIMRTLNDFAYSIHGLRALAEDPLGAGLGTPVNPDIVLSVTASDDSVHKEKCVSATGVTENSDTDIEPDASNKSRAKPLPVCLRPAEVDNLRDLMPDSFPPVVGCVSMMDEDLETKLISSVTDFERLVKERPICGPGPSYTTSAEVLKYSKVTPLAVADTARGAIIRAPDFVSAVHPHMGFLDVGDVNLFSQTSHRQIDDGIRRSDTTSSNTAAAIDTNTLANIESSFTSRSSCSRKRLLEHAMIQYVPVNK